MSLSDLNKQGNFSLQRASQLPAGVNTVSEQRSTLNDLAAEMNTFLREAAERDPNLRRDLENSGFNPYHIPLVSEELALSFY
jgi:hypothetical protein